MKWLLTVLLLATTPAFAQGGANWLHGHWFGSGQPDDRSKMWLDLTAPDGRFHVLHRTCREGKAFDTIEEGRWSLKGDVLTITIEKIDGKPAARDVDVYRILKHDARSQTYRYEETGFVYSSRKVDAKFQMPPCDLSS
jgi:hypothetical protein